MSNLLNNSVSGLLAAQRRLDTTGHNISNANVDGYSRQRVEQGTRPAQELGDSFQGRGTQINGVERIYDDFLGEQVRSSTAEFEKLDAFEGLASRVDDVLADPDAGLTPKLQDFFDAVEDVKNDPGSTSARQVLVSEADALVNRFETLDLRMDDLASEANTRIRDKVSEINSLTGSIAEINNEIAAAKASGNTPNDLLDSRDQKLEELSEIVRVERDVQDDGSVNVFTRDGTNLVLGNDNTELDVRENDFDPERLEVVEAGGPETGDISDSFQSGELGGILDFRDEILDSTRNELGKIAHGLSENFNALHREGIDLDGELGGDFFSIGSPDARAARGNDGDAQLEAEVTDSAELTGGDYRLRFDNGDWDIVRADTGEEVDFDGDGSAGDPFTFDGLSVELDGTPEDEDEFLLQPTRNGARTLETEISDSREVAAAAPIMANADADNLGTGEISPGEVIDIDDPDLQETVEIEFIDEDTFEIDGDTFTYEPGEAIEENGWRVEITGSPEEGDVFTVEANTDADGDNRNISRLGELSSERVLDGGNSSLQDAVGGVVSDVATRTSQAQTNREAQQSVRDQARESLESVSGVNLDEEAANLVQDQQAFQASAQAIQVADTVFESLIGAVRG